MCVFVLGDECDEMKKCVAWLCRSKNSINVHIVMESADMNFWCGNKSEKEPWNNPKNKCKPLCNKSYIFVKDEQIPQILYVTFYHSALDITLHRMKSTKGATLAKSTSNDKGNTESVYTRKNGHNNNNNIEHHRKVDERDTKTKVEIQE